MSKLIPVERIQGTILIIRSHKVILDADLASLYGVTTKRLNQQVNRNGDRFPDDFMFTLTPSEKTEVVANCNHLRNLKFSPVMPKAFTEHGALMVSSILNTPVAITTGVYIVRAFVKLREILASQKDLFYRMFDLEKRIVTHDERIQSLWDAIEKLKEQPEEKFPKVKGFKKEG